MCSSMQTHLHWTAVCLLVHPSRLLHWCLCHLGQRQHPDEMQISAQAHHALQLHLTLQIVLEQSVRAFVTALGMGERLTVSALPAGSSFLPAGNSQNGKRQQL